MKDLERVHSIDDGSVGAEARLISAKALMKLEKPADAVTLLEPATKLEAGAGRAQVALALAHFSAGQPRPRRRPRSRRRWTATRHYGKALLGRIRRRVENVAAAQPGSMEEALLYAQTYGDVWTDAAKTFLEGVVDEKPAKQAPAPAAAEEAKDEAST